MTTILFAGGGTGGHLYPGLAIARALVSLDSDIRPVFVGAKRGIEKEVLPKSKFPYELLDLHPLYRTQPWQNWRTLVYGIGAWRSLGKLMSAKRPRVVVGTGGYAAGIALAYAALHKIPIVQHAGDSYPGLTARWFAPFSREMYLGFPEAEEHLSHRRATFVATGNPIDPPPQPRPDRAAAREKWGFPRRGGKVLLAYGGSQGSVAMNEVIDEWVTRGIPDDVYLIWGTGLKNFEAHKALNGGRVVVRSYLSPISDAYAVADLALVRAGAMTTSELCAWGIPQILVPLPGSAAGHQEHNARSLELAGAGIHLPQSEMTVGNLNKIVTGLVSTPARLAALSAGALERARPDAALEIAQRILRMVKGRSSRKIAIPESPSARPLKEWPTGQ